MWPRFFRRVRHVHKRVGLRRATTVGGAVSGLFFTFGQKKNAEIKQEEIKQEKIKQEKTTTISDCQLTEYEEKAKQQFFTAAHSSLPLNWTGPVFVPNFAFPQNMPEQSDQPWTKINFKTEPEVYLRTVLDYCFENNIVPDTEKCFQTSSKWFHAPWQHASSVGREPIHGCTQERPSDAGWLGPGQERVTQTLAVAFYNEPGGYIFGQVWKDPSAPNIQGVKFPEGTVTFKLLFTQATPEEVPYLEGAPVWQTMVQSYNAVSSDPDPPRVLGDVRLLQIDIAVADRRFDNPTGWCFGSFTYDSSVAHDNPWRRLIPVGLQWGNDPLRTLAQLDEPLKEGWLNPVAKKRIVNEARPMVGLDNRVVGPADNFISSCSACHMTAQYPSVNSLVLKRPKEWNSLKQDIGVSERSYFFKNLFCGEIFDDNMDFYQPAHLAQEVFSLDYSLQLQSGLNNFHAWRSSAFPKIAQEAAKKLHHDFVPGARVVPSKVAQHACCVGPFPARHTER